LIVIPEKYDTLLLNQRATTNRREILKFAKDHVDSLLSIKPVGESILDIGCGLGIMMAMLEDNFKEIHLADKSIYEEGKRLGNYGDMEGFGYYNDLEFAKELVEEHTSATVFCHSPEDLPDIKFDVISSFYSWGYHYSSKEYLEYAKSHLNEDGVIVLTLKRNGSEINKKIISSLNECGVDFTTVSSFPGADLVYIKN
jgi:SAM-dependent methyltransferase